MDTSQIDQTIAKHKELMRELENARNCLTDVAIAFEEEENREKVKEFEQCFIAYLMDEDDIATHIQVLEEAKQRRMDNDLAEFMKTRLKELKKKKNPTDYLKKKKFIDFKTKIWMKVHPDEEPDESLLGGKEDVLLVSQDINTKCPLTAQVMEEPVKNSVCGHSYDKKAVIQYIHQKQRDGHRIKRNRVEVSCPVAGCSARLREDELERDVEIERHLKKLLRKKIHSSEDDIIEV